MSQEDFSRLPEFREQESHYMDAEEEWDEKLKPCPFCGAPAELQTVPDDHPDSGGMFCQCSGNGCLASSALILPLMDDVTGLVRERWNRRTDDKYIKALAGLPDGAIDGGWTAAGMSAYARKLEDALNQILCLSEAHIGDAYIIAGEALALRHNAGIHRAAEGRPVE